MYELTCVVHVHSAFSDGTATVPEIGDAARATGAGVVLLTDHDTLEARRRGLEGWRDDVLTLVGVELSPRAGHLLAFGLDQEIDHRGLSEIEMIEAVRDAGGIAFAAHPFSEGSRMSQRIGRPHPWGALDHPSLTGLEVWSLLTDAAEAWSSPTEALRFMRRPASALSGPPAGHLARWDELTARRRLVAIGGLDAHQTGVRLPSGRVLSPFPHSRFFGWLRTHLLVDRPLSGEVDADRDLVYGALAAGRCFIGVDGVAPTAGFRFFAQRNGTRVEMGDQAEPGDWTIEVRLPLDGRMRLLRDGAELLTAEGRELAWPAYDRGAYRVEVEREAGTWILSNPIYLR